MAGAAILVKDKGQKCGNSWPLMVMEAVRQMV